MDPKEYNMKLKSDFIAQVIDDTQFLVPIGGESFKGIVRSNKTAAFIVDCLKEETTEEAIVDEMCRKYDAPREVIAEDVKGILNTLRRIGALEE
jgi:hypothetical protein